MSRKKFTPIKTLGSDDTKLIVQKSLPLFSLWRSQLTLAEFKILDTYLSRIDSHNPDKRVVTFNKGELESLLGLKQIRIDDLKQRLKNLMETTVELTDSSEKKGFRLLLLFEEAIAEQDDYGQWTVRLECSQKAMKYFFNMEELGYLRYKLRSVINITSRYSYIMFLYLEHNRFRKSWEVDLQELKKILDCENESYCNTFKVFNDRLLKRVQNELHEKTECRYEYEPIKRGRCVVSVRFTLHTLSDELIDYSSLNQISLLDENNTDDEKEIDYGSSLANLLGEAACKHEFSVEQIKMIKDLVIKACPSCEPLERCNYLISMMNKMDYYGTISIINNRFNYLCGMLRAECGE